MTLRIGSLFSGIGGLDLGSALALARRGIATRTAWQVEWNDYCRAVLARHWPGVPQYGDITQLDPATLSPVDLLTAGFPCPPVSVAGKRKAQDDDRWLWPDVARVLRVLRPRIALLENVPGILSAGVGGRGSALGEVLGDLAELGFDAWWTRLGACDAGAPHLRERWFCLAVADGVRDGLEGVVATGTAPRAALRGSEVADGPDSATAPGRTLPRLDGVPDGLSAGLDRGRDTALEARSALDALEAHAWPAGRNEPQHAHEPPRLAPTTRDRAARISALGNAVVPQQAALALGVLLDAARQDGVDPFAGIDLHHVGPPWHKPSPVPTTPSPSTPAPRCL